MRRRVKFRNTETDKEVSQADEAMREAATDNVQQKGEFIDGIDDFDALVEKEMKKIIDGSHEWIYGFLIYIGQESRLDPETRLPMLDIVGVIELDDGTVTHLFTRELFFVGK